MGKRKTFERGQTVEVQREPGAAWETATYKTVLSVGPYDDEHSSPQHNVELPASAPPRIVEIQSFAPYETRSLTVPSRRIRAKESK